ncbi:MAG: phage tail protein [Lachnospiraceae bacterium]|nr:phage tail protein [Lachnospiraceae bacterium]
MAHSANNTKISYKVGNAAFIEIPFLMEVPELGGAPEKIDITTLSDPVKRYIPGIKEYGDLVFKFLYDNLSETANFRVLKDMDDKGTTATFKLAYPDGTSHQFDAIPSVTLDAGAINGALTFSATMMLQSDIEISNPTA